MVIEEVIEGGVSTRCGTADENEMTKYEWADEEDVVLAGIESASANTPVCERFPCATA